MSVDLFRIHGPEAEKSRDQRLAPALSWLVARIKPVMDAELNSIGIRNSKLDYAVLLGLTVKSRTWVRMLDICIPFSCETNGIISAMN